MISKVDILQEKIIGKISSGKIKPGEMLPSRHQYMRRYNCARGTIDAAISRLAKDGFVYSRQGGGTYVAEKSTGNRIQQIFIMDSGGSSEVFETGLQSGKLAGECQGSIPSTVFAMDDAYVNLDKFARPGNGVVWVRPSYNYLMAMNYLSDMAIPQLLIGRSYSNFDFVTTDAKKSIKEGLEHLKGVTTEITFVSEKNDPDRPYIAERQIAFYQSCVELNIKIRGEWIFDFDKSNFADEISRIGKKLFLREDYPRGIFLENIQAAIPLITFAEAHGKTLGRDFFLLLFDKEPNLMNRTGILMLNQQWEAMENQVIEWVKTKNKDLKKEFKQKIKTELIVN